ncbi:MAG: hypothetical protein JST01_25870 [Cyanobacteria bacterium SZAS TMP-1]|nr:hypothetical protein [Cyanobacteria bacterium SZAS TMP-1]
MKFVSWFGYMLFATPLYMWLFSDMLYGITQGALMDVFKKSLAGGIIVVALYYLLPVAVIRWSVEYYLDSEKDKEIQAKHTDPDAPLPAEPKS